MESQNLVDDPEFREEADATREAKPREYEKISAEVRRLVQKIKLDLSCILFENEITETHNWNYGFGHPDVRNFSRPGGIILFKASEADP